MQQEVAKEQDHQLSQTEQHFVAENLSKCGARVLSALVACGGQATYEKLMDKMQTETIKNYRLPPSVTKFRRVTSELSKAFMIAKAESENDLSNSWYSITDSGRKILSFIKKHYPHLLEPSKSP